MIGSTIGHYAILEKLGEGGMGVVFKAQDTTLDRLVALKFLPEQVSTGSADLERFIQEAKAAAALNHPNICTIYGIEEFDKKHFIVMEFVDGQTLQEKKSSLSQKQALEVGVQIAEGLAAAHEKGIVHRDIKPENVMFRKDGRVQIMDFGLAKLRGASRLTKEGSTVGTAGYMSPEQVQGQETDHRSDIFSFGVLLFEMLTGQPPFKGMHETAITYEIVNVDSPPMSTISSEIPPELDAIVLECLEKDPRERTQSASQVAVDLRRYRRESSRQRASRITARMPVAQSSDMYPTSSFTHSAAEAKETRSPVRRFILPAAIGLGSLTLGIGGAALMMGGAPETQIVRATIESPPSLEIQTGWGGHMAISPDGSLIAFVGIDSLGKQSLWIRPLGVATATVLAETQGAEYPFWSPDGRSIGFFTESKLKRVDVAGTPPLDVADVIDGRGGTWSKDGTILYVPSITERNLYGVPAAGGTPSQVTSFDSASGSSPRFPFFLPDGNHFLFVLYRLGTITADASRRSQAYVGALDGSVTELPLVDVSNMMYSSGYLFYTRGGTLIAHRFDPASFEISGDPIPIENNVSYYSARAKSNFSVSGNNVIIFGKNDRASDTRLVWIDRNGRQEDLLVVDPVYVSTLSPDGSKVAYDEAANDDNIDVWVYDITRRVKTRLTFDKYMNAVPRWSNDASSLFITVLGEGAEYSIRKYRADGSGEIGTLIDPKYSPGTPMGVIDVSPDNRYALMQISVPSSGWDIFYKSLDSDDDPTPLVNSKFSEVGPQFSPDGKWFVYQSNESGANEIYVRPFPGGQGKWQVSTSGGEGPKWTRTGEIFYSDGSSLVVVQADIKGGTPRFSLPRSLFQVGRESGIEVVDVTRDGKRFLATKSSVVGRQNNIAMYVHWHESTQGR